MAISLTVGHGLQFLGIFDCVILDMTVDHFTEQIHHTHTVVGMSRAAGCDHAAEIAGHDGINGGAANTDLAVRVFGIEPAGPHETVLAAGRIGPDGTGLHVDRPIKGRIHPVAPALGDHLLGGLASGKILYRYQFCFIVFILNIRHNVSLHGKIACCDERLPLWF